MGTLQEIGTYLQAQGVGTLGTNLFTGLMPDTPDACVALLEYPGGAGIYTFGSGGTIIENPRIQVIARGTTYPGAQSSIHSVYTALDGLVEQVLSGTLYHLITAVQPPFGFPLDLNNRYVLACNFSIQKSVS